MAMNHEGITLEREQLVMLVVGRRWHGKIEIVFTSRPASQLALVRADQPGPGRPASGRAPGKPEGAA